MFFWCIFSRTFLFVKKDSKRFFLKSTPRSRLCCKHFRLGGWSELSSLKIQVFGISIRATQCLPKGPTNAEIGGWRMTPLSRQSRGHFLLVMSTSTSTSWLLAMSRNFSQWKVPTIRSREPCLPDLASTATSFWDKRSLNH